MSVKLFLHTTLCLALAMALAWHIRAGHRRVALSCLLASVLWLGAGPFLPRPWFPRVTINWAQVAVLAVSLVVFTPSRRHDAELYDDDANEPRAAQQPTIH